MYIVVSVCMYVVNSAVILKFCVLPHNTQTFLFESRNKKIDEELLMFEEPTKKMFLVSKYL